MSTPLGRARGPALLAVVVCLAATGCVQRRMMIRSNPPGAVVYVDNYEIGTTPIATNFIYYGTRQIRLVKDGYETLTVEQPVPPPWYQIPPLDFVTENMVPGEIRDRREFTYQLVPQMVVPTEQLVGRGEDLRQRVRSASGVQVSVPPPPASGPPPQGYPPPQFSPTPANPPAVGGAQPLHALPPTGR